MRVFPRDDSTPPNGRVGRPSAFGTGAGVRWVFDRRAWVRRRPYLSRCGLRREGSRRKTAPRRFGRRPRFRAGMAIANPLQATEIRRLKQNSNQSPRLRPLATSSESICEDLPVAGRSPSRMSSVRRQSIEGNGAPRVCRRDARARTTSLVVDDPIG